ncbi:MAG: hypothetical protein Q7T55_24145 [Solirubrobacteraceae bacterium]|nr:hypothetical protein [Solirubrobacteraceae bacterium]
MTKRDRLMLTAVLAVALLGGFWMFVLSPQRKDAAEAAAAVATAEQDLNAAKSKVDAGQKAQQSFRKDRNTIVRLGRVVPETDDVPTLLTQLQALAKKEKVTFLTYQVDAGGSTASATSDVTNEKPSNTTGAQTGSGSTAAVAPLFPPGTVEIEGGLGRTPITLEFKGSYFQLERYLRAVQRFAVLSQKSSKASGRLMIVDAFSYEFESDAGGSEPTDGKLPEAYKREPALKAKLSASVYFAPPLDAPAAKSAGAAAAPAGGSSAATSGSSTGTAAIGGVQ